VPLTQSSIFGTGQEAVVPCSWEGNRGSDVTDFSGLSTYRLTAQEREISTLPTLLMGVWHAFTFMVMTNR